MASGVKVNENVVRFFKSMKKANNTDERVRLATFSFQEDGIDVENTYTQKELDDKNMDGFDFFMTMLTAAKCQYILYDCHFSTKESSNKEELVFVMCCPENCSVKEKMIYASSRDSLKKTLGGIKHNLQINDLSDCPDRYTFSGELGKTVTHIEGVAVTHSRVNCNSQQSKVDLMG